MNNPILSPHLKSLEIPGRVKIGPGNGGLMKVEATSDVARVEVYFHGAHVTGFQKNGDAPLLFMSESSRFEAGQPIRGGIPIIFPWFGPREGEAAHGFGRLLEWELREAKPVEEGGVSLRFGLLASPAKAPWPPLGAEYLVTVTSTLTLQLSLTNLSDTQDVSLENCLHTYFLVGDCETIQVRGLGKVEYLDKLEGFARRSPTGAGIRIASEVDRVYVNTADPVEILDPTLKRIIRIEKTGSASTVVWNPWVAKSRQMPDFGDEEFHRMVCVESGNVGENQLPLRPGQTSVVKVTVSSSPLGLG